MSAKKKKAPTSHEGRRPVPEWLAVKLDFPPDVLCGGMRVELRGRNALTVHGCHRILTYTPCMIRLALTGCILRISGERLICQSYLAGAVGVDGRIDTLHFESEEDEICSPTP